MISDHIKPRLPEPSRVESWLLAAAESIDHYRSVINNINVFPHQDRDTGSNLSLTLHAALGAWEARDGLSDTWGSRLSAAARQASRHALGNSGTMFVSVLSALAERLGSVVRLDAVNLAEALRAAEVRVAGSLSERAPASMLDALAAAASCRPEPDSGYRGLLLLLNEQVEAVRSAVHGTYAATQTLEKYQVVDAGALGFLIIVEAFRASVSAEEFRHDLLRDLPGLEPAQRDPEEDSSGVEVVCGVEANPLDAALLRSELDAVGQSLMMTTLGSLEPQGNAAEDQGSGEDRLLWRIHVHVEHEDLALEIISKAGPIRDVSVTRLIPTGEEQG